MRLWIPAFFCLITLSKAAIYGSGLPLGILASWVSDYKAIVPDFDLHYNATTGPLGLRAIVDGTSPYNDFTVSDSPPSPSDLATNPHIQVFPIVSNTLVPQYNIPNLVGNLNQLVLGREVLVRIFMGNITKWNDPAILDTNKPLQAVLPNSTITVHYRLDPSGFNSHVTSVLSAFSPLWAAKYGVTKTWPVDLQALPNFVASTTTLMINAKIISFPNSIGYAAYSQVARDPTIPTACLYDKSGAVICPSAAAIAAAVSTIPLTHSLITSYAIDPSIPGAWPSGVYLNGLVHTNPTPDQCAEQRELYRFLLWAFTEENARAQVSLAGFAPLSPSVSNYVLSVLGEIKCGGKSVLGLEPVDTRGPTHEALIIFNSLFFVFIIGLSITHLVLFRGSTLNEVYTIIFMLGSIIILSAPYVWNMIPDRNAVCIGRAWLTSMGFALLLGTMFSRTSQLRDIYMLQKKTLDSLQSKITVRSSLHKLGLSLFLVTFVNFVLLLTWTLVDPYTAYLRPSDLQLHGLWKCESRYLSIWMSLQVSELAFLIAFGVYVIYRTWAFQRAAVIRETRWVLIVLYNIVLNAVAAMPAAVMTKANDADLVILMIISLIFSGGGIVLAFLLPRILRHYRHRNDVKEDRQSRESTGETPPAKLRVRMRDPVAEPASPTNHNSEVQAEKEDLQPATRVFSSSLSTYHSVSSLYNPNTVTPDLLPATPTYSPNMVAINEEGSDGHSNKNIEMMSVKPRVSSRPSLITRKNGVPEENVSGSEVDSEHEDKPMGEDMERSGTASGRQLDIPREDQHLLDNSPNPLPNRLLWSTNPLAGTESNTPMEDETPRDL